MNILENSRPGYAQRPRGWMCRTMVVIGAVWLFSSSGNAQPFVLANTNMPSVYKSSAAWGDFDNDGDLDLLMAGGSTIYGTFTRIYRNDGNGRFTDIAAGFQGIDQGSVATADYDNDGYLDVVLTGLGGSVAVTKLYRNNRNGTFSEVNASLPAAVQSSVAWGDFDSDGDQDLWLTGWPLPNNTFFSRVYRNHRDGTFSDFQAGLSEAAAATTVWGDADNDGDVDALFLRDNFSAGVWYNNGRGGFAGIAGVAGSYQWPSGAWGDYNGDGLLDIVIGRTYESYVYQNNGGSFSIAASLRVEVGRNSANWGDFDNDGDLDLLMGPKVFRNDGNRVFTDINAGLANFSEGVCLWGDYDNDGDLDVFLMGFEPRNVRLYRNDAPRRNTLPSPPANPRVTVLPENQVLFTWDRATDSETTNALLLQYNLRVGSTPGGVDIVSPHSDPATGYRRLVQLGNVAPTNRWKISELPKGTYYWSVQAIDTAWAGSAFSPEAVFEITNSRPVISDIADRTVFPGQPTAPIFFTVGDGETPPGELIVSATSSDSNLVSVANMVFGGSGADRTLIITPRDLVGSVTITVTVTDAIGLSASNAFVLTLQRFVPAADFGRVRSQSPAWGDYDNDGDFDLLLTSYDQYALPRTSLYRNDGGGVFVDVRPGLPTSAHLAAWGDYDNDGDLDLLMAGYDGSAIYQNNGGNFADIGAGLPPFSVGTVAWGDFDNDADLDLLMTGSSGNTAMTRLYRNNGADHFSETQFNLPEAFFSAAWGDYDNDRDLDLVLVNNRGVLLFRNDGGANFNFIATSGLPTSYASSVSWGDFDNDGDLDMLADSVIYRNNGNGTFTNILAGLPFVYGSSAWGDYNNDGHLDILVSGTTNVNRYVTQVYRNSGSGTFSLAGSELPRVGGLANWIDYDSDGDLDVFVTGTTNGEYSGNISRLYQNTVDEGNLPPAAPANLSSAIQLPDNRVQLSWQPPSDDHAPAGQGLYYNLRIGTTPGGSEIMSAQANPQNGRRLVLNGGNAGLTPGWLLIDPPIGTYYWSVQAIDQGFAGSAFAAEATFEITNSRPTISSLARISVSPGLPSATVAFTVGDADTPAGELIVTASSSVPEIALNENLVIGGSGANRTITITRQSNRLGETLITVTVTDAGGLNVTGTFVFDVEQFALVPTPLMQGPVTVGAWGDFDNDGDLDLLQTGGTSTNTQATRLHENNGDGTFTTLTNRWPTVAYGTVAWGDYDNDGDVDLFLGGASTIGYLAYIYRNDGGGSFTLATSLPQGVAYGTADWGDFDNDGDLDLLVSGTRIYRNDGANRFTNIGANLAGVYDGTARWGDFDGDGDLDVLLAGSLGAFVYRNDGRGIFTDIGAGLYRPPGNAASASWGDFDNDGDLDILLAAVGTLARIYRNNGDGTFNNSVFLSQIFDTRNTAWGDFDNDGWLDILIGGRITSSNRLTVVYRSNGDGTFSDIEASLPAVSDGSLVWGDYDNDGDLDALVTGSTNGATSGGLAHLYRNEAVQPNTTPSIPGGVLTQLLPQNDVLLTWSPASDDATGGSGGLTYNLRLGTSSNAVGVISPHAEMDTGFRRIVSFGNVGPGTVRRLVDVPRGDYVWSVQAIDPALAGSPFSAEGSFSITNSRPTISNIPDQRGQEHRRIFPQQGITNITFTIGDYETPAADLILMARSGNTNLMPDENMVFGGAGSNRTVTILPSPTWISPVTITVTVSDPQGLTASDSFTIVVELVTPIFTSLPSVRYAALAWGDYDNDNDLDLLVAGQQNYTNLAKIYRNNGSNSFTDIAANLPAMLRSSAAWGDYDNDGDLDVLLSAQNGTFVCRNNAGSFPMAVSIPGSGGHSVWVDVDNDGDLDIFTTGSGFGGSSLALIRKNDGQGGFGMATTGGLPAQPSAWSEWADFDNDGDQDLLLSGLSFNSITRLYRNNGNDTFTQVATNLPALSESSGAWGDFDNDGDWDLLLTGRAQMAGSFNYTNIANVFRNDGNGVFTGINAGLTGVLWGSAKWGDFDSDGHLDILLAGSLTYGTSYNVANARIYRNNRDGTFTDIQAGLTGVYNAAAAWGDYDQDGDLDLVLSGQYTDYDNWLTVYRNNFGLSNAPPAAPDGVEAIVVGRNVMFGWMRPADAETAPNQGLNYNLQVGTAANASRTLASQADVATGFRRVVQRGNAGATNGWTLKNLLPGDYTWSVQAIDTSFAGSPFAVGGQFTLENHRPLVFGQSLSMAEDSIRAITLDAVDADGQPLQYLILTPPTYGVLESNGSLVIYRPASNYFGADAFAFAVNDGMTNSELASVALTILPVQDTNVVHLSLQAKGGGGSGFELTLRGEPYQRYRIEASEDLATWTELTIVQASSLGEIVFTDAPAGFRQRFYRPREVE